MEIYPVCSIKNLLSITYCLRKDARKTSCVDLFWRPKENSVFIYQAWNFGSACFSRKWRNSGWGRRARVWWRLSYRELCLLILLTQTIPAVVKSLLPTNSTTACWIASCLFAAVACNLGFQGSAVNKVDRDGMSVFVVPASLSISKKISTWLLSKASLPST